MKFGPVAPCEALGATAVHSIRQGSLVLKKGTVIGPPEVAALNEAGVKHIVVAQLEDVLGLDPFSSSADAAFPVTLGQFIKSYEGAAAQ